MISKVAQLSFKDIPHFSSKDKMYQLEDGAYEGFYKYRANIETFKDVIKNRKQFSVDRSTLVKVLRSQYKNNPHYHFVKDNIESLENDNTFTVTTAHQPVLFLGPLYTVYKILSTINLCKSLKKEYPEYNFVPVFVSGGEDHDLEEVATMHIFNKDITWNSTQKGAVGRMNLDGLPEAIEEVIALFGSSPFADELKYLMQDSYNSASDYGSFNANLLKSLFSDLGLIVLNMDNSEFKEIFLPYALKEVTEQISHEQVIQTQKELAHNGIKEQAHVRKVNLFLMENQSRNRIKVEGAEYTIGDHSYTQNELLQHLKASPQKISPNVIMRPIFQEVILPNLAYIGGGGEIAYWLERKNQFAAFNVPFPMLIRRNSALIIPSGSQKTMTKLEMSDSDFFKSKDDLIKLFLSKKTNEDYTLKEESEKLEKLFKSLSLKAKSVDSSLEKYTLAEGAKQLKAIKAISGKMNKAAKSNNEIQLQRLEKVRNKLFPNNSLQERYDNFIPFYLKYGKNWFKELLEYMDPMNKNFILINE